MDETAHTFAQRVLETSPQGLCDLIRNSYDVPALTGLVRAKPAEVRDFVAGTLASHRALEFTGQPASVGIRTDTSFLWQPNGHGPGRDRDLHRKHER